MQSLEDMRRSLTLMRMLPFYPIVCLHTFLTRNRTRRRNVKWSINLKVNFPHNFPWLASAHKNPKSDQLFLLQRPKNNLETVSSLSGLLAPRHRLQGDLDGVDQVHERPSGEGAAGGQVAHVGSADRQRAAVGHGGLPLPGQHGAQDQSGLWPRRDRWVAQIILQQEQDLKKCISLHWSFLIGQLICSIIVNYNHACFHYFWSKIM